jgi:hypothetical protein
MLRYICKPVRKGTMLRKCFASLIDGHKDACWRRGLHTRRHTQTHMNTQLRAAKLAFAPNMNESKNVLNLGASAKSTCSFPHVFINVEPSQPSSHKWIMKCKQGGTVCKAPNHAWMLPCTRATVWRTCLCAYLPH